jgi:DNA-binding NtrC family response regulator
VPIAVVFDGDVAYHAFTMARILIVDDDPKVLKLLEALLRADGHEPSPVPRGDEALRKLEAQSFELMVTDLRMEPMDGMTLARAVRDRYPHLPIIVLTAYGTLETAEEALNNGTFDYLTKPFKVNDLTITIKRALEDARKKAELAGLQAASAAEGTFGGIVVQSEAMQRVCEQVRRVAPTDASVLFTGESGTGKEMLARALHTNSRRKDKPWQTINCASLASAELEGALFGGGRKGDEADNAGLFVAAEGGTLFLDEISCISPAMQDRLLRVLRDREMTPPGATAPVSVNVRLLAASDISLEERVQAGAFSKDLYLRLAVIVITIPSLRNRPDDILPMVQHFLRRGRGPDDPSPRLSHEVANVLTHYPWPGNVRELGNTIRHAMTFMSGDEITMDCLPPRIVAHGKVAGEAGAHLGSGGHRHVFLRAFLQRARQQQKDAPSAAS